MDSWKIFILTLSFFLTLPLTSFEAEGEPFHVVYDSGFLSVAVEKADLQEVLAVIAEKADIWINAPENLKKPVTVEFDRVPLEEALHRVLRDVNHVLVFSPPEGKTGEEILAGVVIPSEEVSGARGARRTPASSPVRSRLEAEEADEEGVENNEMLVGEAQREEEDQEDALLERYERQLDQLEEQLDVVGEESPQGKALMKQITRLTQQIEKRLEHLDEEESQ